MRRVIPYMASDDKLSTKEIVWQEVARQAWLAHCWGCLAKVCGTQVGVCAYTSTEAGSAMTISPAAMLSIGSGVTTFTRR